jgi:hypothetical protein
VHGGRLVLANVQQQGAASNSNSTVHHCANTRQYTRTIFHPLASCASPPAAPTWHMAPQAAFQPSLPSAHSAAEGIRPAAAAALPAASARPEGAARSEAMRWRSLASAPGTFVPLASAACAGEGLRRGLEGRVGGEACKGGEASPRRLDDGSWL